MRSSSAAPHPRGVPTPGPFLPCLSCSADIGASASYCAACAKKAPRLPDEYLGKKVVGKYKVEALIGEGGMGKVYRARQLALDKQVVLKVLHATLLSDERTVARFQREAKAASRLNHPNSISVLDFGQIEDGSLYIAMEFVAGKDLHVILSKEWPLPEARIVRIVSQVLSALADAHAAGVIHRDLKPENIMVEQRRHEPDFVKVLDFGIAKIQDTSQDEGPALTRAGFVCGTPEYMSPEQARGATLDARSDLYAVGVLLYQLSTGVLPFQADSAVGFATKHLNEEPLPPSRRRPEAKVSAGLERLILRALSKDPQHRPPSAEVFLTELLAVAPDRRQGLRARASEPTREAALQKPQAEDVEETRLTQPKAWGTERTVRQAPHRKAALTEPAAPTEAWVLGVPPRLGHPLIKALGLTVGVAGLGLGLFWARHEVEQEEVTPPARASPRGVPLAEQTIPEEQRDPAAATRWAKEGEQARARGELELATRHYEQAFALHPSPDFSLKLGELYWQRRQVDSARAWWQRHLQDDSKSRARAYIETTLSGQQSRENAP